MLRAKKEVSQLSKMAHNKLEIALASGQLGGLEAEPRLREVPRDRAGVKLAPRAVEGYLRFSKPPLYSPLGRPEQVCPDESLRILRCEEVLGREFQPPRRLPHFAPRTVYFRTDQVCPCSHPVADVEHRLLQNG